MTKNNEGGRRGRFARVKNWLAPQFDNFVYIHSDELDFVSRKTIDDLADLYYDPVATPAEAATVIRKRIAYIVELFVQLSHDRDFDSRELNYDEALDWCHTWDLLVEEQKALNKWSKVFHNDPANWAHPLLANGLVEGERT